MAESLHRSNEFQNKPHIPSVLSVLVGGRSLQSKLESLAKLSIQLKTDLPPRLLCHSV